MHRARRATLFILFSLSATGSLAGCGGGGHAQPPPRRDGNPFPDNPRAPLDATVTADPALSGDGVNVQAVSYTTFDGTRVPALLAVSQRVRPRGCLVYQGGIGQVKELSRFLWPGAAALGLATFTIDPRYTGARGSAAELDQAERTPAAIRTEIVDSVRDLRRGLDYLESRPECHGDIGYLGTSFGGILGAALAGDDRRVRAVVLTSIGATFAEALTIPGSPLAPGVASDPPALAAALALLDPLNPSGWVARIAPRPVMLVNGTNDPYVPPIDAYDLARAARPTKVVLSFDGGHNPFVGPWAPAVANRVAAFLVEYLLGGSAR
jgi:pimeloyl-ACP methyl ester carboxylesterase